MQRTPDATLVERSRAGDPAAFAQLFARYAGFLFGYLYRVLGDRTQAEELTLESFVHAHRHLAHLGTDGAFRAWLYRIASDLLAEDLQQRRQPHLGPWDSGIPPASPGASAAGVGAAAQQAVWRTLQQLPANYRQALVLREFCRLPYTEIAAALGDSPQAVRTTLHRARVLFRDLYIMQTSAGPIVPERETPACQMVCELVSAAHDGEISAAERAGLDAHLGRCPGCQKLQRDLAAVSRALATLEPLALPAGLRARFAAYLGVQVPASSGGETAPATGRTGMGRYAPWLALALGGSGLLILIAVAGLVFVLLPRARGTGTGTGTVTPSPATSPTVAVAAGSPVATAPTGAPTSTPRPTSTPTPPSAPTAPVGNVPTATAPASPAYTETPAPTGSATPTPAIRFWADATAVPAGSCTTVRWETANVRAVFLNGAGVAGVGSRPTCPCRTEIHRLEVELSDGTRQVRELTIEVSGTCTTPSPTATPDTQPPPAPTPLQPVDVVLDCRPTVTLAWSASEDPSGIAGYTVRLEELREGTAQPVGEWGPLSATQMDAFVSCGRLYRWAVQVEDRAANRSPWSAWAQFAIGPPAL